MRDSMHIKVCGMSTPENLEAVTALGVSHVGFISFPPSSRHIGSDTMRLLSPRVPEGVKKVLVTVNADTLSLAESIDALKPDILQLHGDETPERCAALRKQAEVWKVFGVDDSFAFDALNDYADVVDAFLFDTRSVKRGGTGKVFNWSLVDSYALDIPFWMSGGIGPEHAARLLTIRHPQLAGIDLNSRFEVSPGVKDPALLEPFITQLKAHDLSR